MGNHLKGRQRVALKQQLLLPVIHSWNSGRDPVEVKHVQIPFVEKKSHASLSLTDCYQQDFESFKFQNPAKVNKAEDYFNGFVTKNIHKDN